MRILALLVIWAGVARAEPTVVQGRITDLLDRPVANARVYVIGTPIQKTRTDKDGRYAVDVDTGGTHGVVIAIDKAQLYRTVIVEPGANTLDIAVELDTHGGEVIRIEDRKRPQPAKPAEPTIDPQKPPPYSDEAVERDAWARAWFLLDVDETGKVTRLKLLKKPGFDLDAIAIETAFALRFTPARDSGGQPMKTYIVWSMEWPSFGWLVQGNGTALRMPGNIRVRGTTTKLTDEQATDSGFDVPRRPLASGVAMAQPYAAVPCAGSGPLNLDLWNPAYRDCSRPDMQAADALPWITRDTADAAVAEIKAAERELAARDVAAPVSKLPSIVSTAITGALAIALVGSYHQYIAYATAKPVDTKSYFENAAARDNWARVSLALTGAVVVSGGITLFLWHRNQARRSFSVQPTTAGATAAFRVVF